MRVLAVVPARGGSKGVPRKNIRGLDGEPLIGHTLRTARHVDEIDLLVVSTDDDEIARISSGYDVEVVIRPANLASDTASTEQALLYTLDALEANQQIFDVVLVLEPTSPFRSTDTIRKAIAMVRDRGMDSVLAVRKTFENIGFIHDGYYLPVVPDAPRRRQLRDPLYIESSTIYATRVDYLRRTGTLVCENWGALVVPELEAVDINTEEDFEYVEFLQKKRREIKNV